MSTVDEVYVDITQGLSIGPRDISTQMVAVVTYSYGCHGNILYIQVIAEGIPQILRCLTIAIGVVYFPEHGVLVFGCGQVHTILILIS